MGHKKHYFTVKPIAIHPHMVDKKVTQSMDKQVEGPTQNHCTGFAWHYMHYNVLQTVHIPLRTV
jgi:hypothetical protein